jgi:hypothetical protein
MACDVVDHHEREAVVHFGVEGLAQPGSRVFCARGGEIIDDQRDMVEAAAAGAAASRALRIEVVEGRRAGIMLLHELDHEFTPLPVSGSVVERGLAPAMQHAPQGNVLGEVVGARAEEPCMLARGVRRVGHEIGELTDGAHVHRDCDR